MMRSFDAQHPRRTGRPCHRSCALGDQAGRHHPGRVHAEQGDDRVRRHRHVDEQGHVATIRSWPTRRSFPLRPFCTANQTYSYTFTKSGSFGYRDALNTKRRGTVTVRPGVSLTAAPPSVSYGRSATLVGPRLECGAAGETVTVDAMECGKTTFTRLATVMSVANGAWTSPAKPADEHGLPRALEEHQQRPVDREGRAHSSRSSAFAPAASPPPSPRAQSFVGKYVVLQRYVR